jgi:hypothetical protein
MRTQIQEHWAEIKQLREALVPDADGAVYLMSQNARRMGVSAGRMSCNTPHVAALMLIQGTHRLATSEEVAQWKAEQAIQKRITEEEHARRQAKVQVTPKIDLGDDFKQLLAKLAAQQQAPSESRESASQPQRHNNKQQN